MITPTREDAFHKAIMVKVLTAFLNNEGIKTAIGFKGGSCASMAGFLDRFSVDLDFDLRKKDRKKQLRKAVQQAIYDLGLEIKTQSTQELFFIVKYNSIYLRNSLKISIIDDTPLSNEYQPTFIPELNHFITCQTIETMFANKLVAVTDRYNKHHQLAGRDIYDIHYFFSHGYSFKKEIIEERTKLPWHTYIRELVEFIKRKFNQRIIDEDLNFLLPPNKFRAIRRSLIPETLVFLRGTKPN